jgi:hypothetical protein
MLQRHEAAVATLIWTAGTASAGESPPSPLILADEIIIFNIRHPYRRCTHLETDDTKIKIEF